MSKIRASFQLNSHIADVCDREATRYALGALSVVPGPAGTVLIAATDTRVLAVNQVPGAADGEQFIPAAPICKLRGQPPRVELNGQLELTTGKGPKAKTIVADGEVTGRFPDLPPVFPEIESADGWRVLTVDAHALAKLASAISTDGKISILLAPVPADNDDSRVDPTEFVTALPVVGDNGFGLAMPCSSETGVEKRNRKGRQTVTSAASVKIDIYSASRITFAECFRKGRAARIEAERVAELERKQRAADMVADMAERVAERELATAE